METSIYQQSSARPSRVWRNLIPALLLCLLASVHAQAQWQPELGQSSYSSLTWSELRTAGDASFSIGRTTDNKVYVWGDNLYSEIHTRKVKSNSKQQQNTPFYVPFPTGEVPRKVDVHSVNGGAINGFGGLGSVAFTCLTQSNKLYGWGSNGGLFGAATAAFPITMNGTNLDTTNTRRKPVLITVPNETSVLDFAQAINSLVVVGGSGKAYYNGIHFTNGSPTYSSTFLQIPFPAGVTGFKRAWTPYNNQAQIFLEGNDNNIYATGPFGQFFTSGAAALNNTANYNYNLPVDVPKLVPFPAGEVIDELYPSYYTTLALTKSGKAFGAGVWFTNRSSIIGASPSNFPTKSGVSLFPLKSPPAAADITSVIPSGFSDTTYFTNRFLEIALPAGATKFINLENNTFDGNHSLYFTTDDNKVYWRGISSTYNMGNDLQYPNVFQLPDCRSSVGYRTISPYSFVEEAINLQGATKIFHRAAAGFVISKSYRGYYFGVVNQQLAGAGLSSPNATHPMPIANELLDNCNPSPGVGGPGGGGTTTGTSSATGVIDCSKTQIVSAPIAGSANQHALIVTITVSATGVFAPISVTGSGMSLANGVSSVDAPKIGTQQFQIPIQYDGTALTNGFTFTVGTAGGCTANLTGASRKIIKNVFTLDNCTAIPPGTLSK